VPSYHWSDFDKYRDEICVGEVHNPRVPAHL
jgi:hypothetical protein